MACNPVAQYNDFTGDGTTVDFTFTFPYLNKTEVQVRFGEYPNYTYPAYTTEYTVSDANPTVVTFVTAPANGADFRIFRCTDGTNLPATFQAGSAIRAADLNDNFEQMLYLVQDANVRSENTQIIGDDAYDRSQLALDTANEALDNSEEAIETAERAEGKADAALDIVAGQIAGTVIQNVGQLPATGAEDLLVYTIIDSTGIENFSPLTGVPPGFVGDPGMSVKLQWQESNGTYIFLSSQANDSDHRYVQQAGDNMSGNLTLGTDKITLDAGDGSATFAGGIDVATRSTFANGVVVIADDGGVNVKNISQSDNNWTIQTDGSATFAGNVAAFDDATPGNGATIYKEGYFLSTRNASDAVAFQANLNSTENVVIKADGSARFAGGTTNISSNGTVRVGENPSNAGKLGVDLNNTGQIRCRPSTAEALKIYPATGTTESIILNSDGTASFVSGAVNIDSLGNLGLGVTNLPLQGSLKFCE